MKKVALVVASEGYQQIEYNNTAEVLKSDGIQVITLSDKPGLAMAKNGDSVKVDTVVTDFEISSVDGIFLIGGPGAIEHLNTEVVYELLKQAQMLQMPYGAICVSPRILAHAGVLTGKKATGWNGDGQLERIFSMHHVKIENKAVVVDGNVITASGPEAADHFGAEIVRLINKK